MVMPTMHDASGVDHPANGPQVGAEGWLVIKAAEPKEPAVPGAAPAPVADAKTDAEKIADLEKQVEDLTAALDAEKEKAAEAKAAAEEKEKADKAAAVAAAEAEPDPIAKALADPSIDPLLKAALQAQVEQAKVDRETVAKMADAEALREFVTKAAAFAPLGCEPGTFGPILKAAAASLSPEQYAELDRVLTSATETAKAAEVVLTQTVGSSGTGPAGPVMSEVSRLAAVKKAADPGIEQAEAAVWDERPDLVAKYRTEGA
jgi:hypothetical protein